MSQKLPMDQHLPHEYHERNEARIREFQISRFGLPADVRDAQEASLAVFARMSAYERGRIRVEFDQLLNDLERPPRSRNRSEQAELLGDRDKQGVSLVVGGRAWGSRPAK